MPDATLEQTLRQLEQEIEKATRRIRQLEQDRERLRQRIVSLEQERVRVAERINIALDRMSGLG